MFTPPAEVEAVLTAFASLFSRSIWPRAQALFCGTLLAPANHTVTAALRALGLAVDPGFQSYHRLLNRVRWSARAASGTLLGLLVTAFAPAGPLILGLDETLERRRGPKIKARAIYRDAARSSRECFQKTSGLALVEPAFAGADPLGQARVGAAFSDHPLSFPTLRPLRTEGQTAQVARRAGAWSHRSGAPLAAGSGARRGGGQRLRGH